MSISLPLEPAEPPLSSLRRNAVSVSIAKPAAIGLGVWMSHLRDWLDQHRIEPVEFRYKDDAWDRQTYEVSFANLNHANLFAAAFEMKHPGQHPRPQPPDVIHPSL